MKTEQLLTQARDALPITEAASHRPPNPRLDAAILEAEALLAGCSGADVDVFQELARRARLGTPVTFARGTISWAELHRASGSPKRHAVASARLRDASALLLPFLVPDHGARPQFGDQLTGSDARGPLIPAAIVLQAMKERMASETSRDSRTLMKALIARMEGDRVMPAWNGRPAAAVLLHDAGLTGKASKKLTTLIQEWSPFFGLDPANSVIRNGEVERIEPAPMRIGDYLDRKAGAGEPLYESTHVPGSASLTEIAREAGISYGDLRNNRHLIDAAVASKRVTLAAPRVRDAVEEDATRELRAQRLRFIDDCVSNEVALPTSASHKGAYDFAAIAVMSGIEGPDLAGDMPYTTAVYRKAPPRLLAFEDARPGTYYGQFEYELRAARQAQVEGKKSSASMLSQTMNAYAEFRRFLGKEAPSALIGGQLESVAAEETIGLMKAACTVANFQRFQSNMRIVVRLHAEVSANEGLGTEPGRALQLAIKRSGKTMPELSDATGLTMGQLTTLKDGHGRRSAGVIAALPALEEACGIRKGLLVGVASERSSKDRMVVGERRVPPNMRDFVAPDWATMDPEDFDRMVEWIDDNIIHQPTPFGKAMQTAVRIGRAAAKIRAEQGFERGFKIGLAPEDQLPFQRTIEQLVVHRMDVFNTEGLKRRHGSSWVPHTARMRMAMLLDLAIRATDPVASGGMGMDPRTFDVPHLLNVDIAKVYVDQAAQRLAEVEFDEDEVGPTKRGAVFTRLHADLMQLLAQIFNEGYGFAYQQPEMASAIVVADARPLPPLKHLVPGTAVNQVLPHYRPPAAAPMPAIPAALVGMTAETYKETSAEAAVKYKSLAADIRQKARRTRDPVATIKGLTDSEEPVRLALGLLADARDRTPGLIANAQAHHCHIRDLVVCGKALILALRPRNMRELTCGGKEVQIRKKDSSWHIEIPHDRFKNWQSAPLFADKSPYRRTLPDMPWFLDLLDYYWTKSRPFLIGDNDSPYFFVGDKGQPLQGLSYWRLTRDFTARHFAYNPYTGRGLEGVMPFNPYAWRYIRATDILLHPTHNANPYLEGANALQTSPEMVLRYYARVRPDWRTSDQDARLIEMMAEVAARAAGRF